SMLAQPGKPDGMHVGCSDGAARYDEDLLDDVGVGGALAGLDPLEGPRPTAHTKRKGTFSLRFSLRYAPFLKHGGTYGRYRHKLSSHKWPYLPYIGMAQSAIRLP